MPRTLPKGQPSLLGTGFKYTPASHTDLAKTFARIRERQQRETKADAGSNVRTLPLRKPG
jgi:hypothetical protein